MAGELEWGKAFRGIVRRGDEVGWVAGVRRRERGRDGGCWDEGH